MTRFTAIRLTKAKAEEHAQYTSSAHLLQWVPSSMLNKYRQGEIMRALRYLQIEGYLNEEEPPVPRADLKKKKTRAVGKRSTSNDMMFNWVKYKRGQLSLRHPISIPQSSIHTVRAVPEVINSLIDKEKPSLYDLATWMNQYYKGNKLNIRQIIDGNILQVLNSIHLRGLLVQIGMGGEIVTLPETEENEDQDDRDEGESIPTNGDHDSDEESDDEEEGDPDGNTNSPK